MTQSTQLFANTPLIKSEKLSNANTEFWLKMDALQPAGSFKNRGISYACQHYAQQGAKKFISSSGGNAGIATAYSGYRLNIPVTVIVPENAPQLSIDIIRQFNAKVIIEGSTWIEAHSYATSISNEANILIHPFDDPLLWPGHATLINEVVEEGLLPDAVVLSVGGGGLLSGVSMGLKNNNLNNTSIFAVETQGAASLRSAINAGKPVMLSEITTIANTLGAKQVSQAAFEATQEFNVNSQIVSDRDALNACFQFLDDHRVLVEPACGASLSLAYSYAEIFEKFEKVLIVVCGGMGVSYQMLLDWDSALN